MPGCLTSIASVHLFIFKDHIIETNKICASNPISAADLYPDLTGFYLGCLSSFLSVHVCSIWQGNKTQHPHLVQRGCGVYKVDM